MKRSTKINTMARLKAVLLALPVAMLPLPALAQVPADQPVFWHQGWNWGWEHVVVGSLMMLLFWGGISLLIVLAVRWAGGESSRAPVPLTARKSPADILRERFARGELDKDEFDARRHALSD